MNGCTRCKRSEGDDVKGIAKAIDFVVLLATMLCLPLLLVGALLYLPVLVWRGRR